MVCAVLCLGSYLTAPIAGGEKLIETAMEQAGSGSAKESIEAFHRELRANWDFAPAGFDMLDAVTICSSSFVSDFLSNNWFF